MSKKIDLFYIYKFNSKFLIDRALDKNNGGGYKIITLHSPYIFLFSIFLNSTITNFRFFSSSDYIIIITVQLLSKYPYNDFYIRGILLAYNSILSNFIILFINFTTYKFPVRFNTNDSS